MGQQITRYSILIEAQAELNFSLSTIVRKKKGDFIVIM